MPQTTTRRGPAARPRRAGVVAALGLALLLTGGTTAPSIAQPPDGAIVARPADGFVESIGINTHWTYEDSAYFEHYDEVSSALVDLGVRHVRASCDGYEAQRRHLELFASHGVRTLVSVVEHWGHEPDLGRIDDALAATLEHCDVAGGQVEGFVGINEWDTQGESGTRSGWVEEYRRWQQRLAERVAAEPALEGLPVVAGPLAHTPNLAAIGDISQWADVGADHPYPGHVRPPDYVYADQTLDVMVDAVEGAVGRRPIWVTETGYAHSDLSDKAVAKLLPRLLASYFALEHDGRHPIERTYLYQLVDNGDGAFGLLDDDLRRRPAFHALRSTIHLLEDASWDTEARRWDHPTTTTSPLDVRLEGDTEGIEQLLLQKRDGRHYLLLWQDVDLFDEDAWSEVDHPDREVTLVLDDAATVSTYVPYDEADPAAVPTPTTRQVGVRSAEVVVPDHLVVVEVEPDDHATLPRPGQRVRLTGPDGRAWAAGADGSLRVDADAPAVATSFDVVDAGAGAGEVCLRSASSGAYVVAERAGAAPLRADRAWCRPWERFTFEPAQDGGVLVRAAVNGRLVRTTWSDPRLRSSAVAEWRRSTFRWTLVG